MTHTSDASSLGVRRRQVYYLQGFDPRDADFYHSVYKRHAQQQSEHAGYEMDVSDIKSSSEISTSWEVTFTENGVQCVTNYTFLSWVGIIKENMGKSAPVFYADTFKTFIMFLRSGIMHKSLEYTKAPVITFSLLLHVILIPIVIAIILSLWFFHAIPLFVAVILFVLAYAASAFLKQKLNTFWVTHGVNFIHHYIKDPKLMDERLAAFVSHIQNDALTDDRDEVLFVGHCYGTILLPILLDRVEQANALDNDKVDTSVLTLAQLMPLMSWHKEAGWYRDTLARVAKQHITWVDFSSPADGVCAPMLDIYQTSDIGVPNPMKLLSPKFHTLFSKKTYLEVVRKNKLRIHFQYILSSENAKNYDFFRYTAGLKTLAEHLKNRPSVTNFYKSKQT